MERPNLPNCKLIDNDKTCKLRNNSKSLFFRIIEVKKKLAEITIRIKSDFICGGELGGGELGRG